jgi:hypothetical protein
LQQEEADPEKPTNFWIMSESNWLRLPPDLYDYLEELYSNFMLLTKKHIGFSDRT